jgi:hypothetical protein
VKKRFLFVVEIEIVAEADYNADSAACYLTGLLNQLQPEDKLIDLTAYELS